MDIFNQVSIGLIRLFLFNFFIAASISASPYSREIKKAVSYLNSRGEKLSFDAVISIELLSRNFDLAIDTSAARSRLLKNPPARLRPFLRVLGKDSRLSHLEISVIKGWIGVNVRAIHCDLYPLPWDFLLNLRKRADRHEFEAVPGIFALSVLEWMHCGIDQGLIEAEKDRLATKLPMILSKVQTGSFLWFECLLAFHQADKGHWVPQEELKKLVRLQRPDGSWQSNDLLTAKAVSILLFAAEKQNPLNKRKRPIRLLPEPHPSLS